MNRPDERELLAFLEGELEEGRRLQLLEQIERDPLLAREVRSVAIGLAAVSSLRGVGSGVSAAARPGRLVSPWWIAAAAVATLVLSVPTTLWLAGRGAPAAVDGGLASQPGRPPGTEQGFVLVLHGRWPDAGMVTETERLRRGDEYWAWTASLARDSLLMAAGDLRWEPGSRLAPGGSAVQVAADVVQSPDFLVGMLALRVGSYEEALAIARECPHLRYGGSVSVRRVGSGFLTTRGAGG